MRATRWARLVVGLLALTGCQDETLVATSPVIDELWLGPDIVASEPELQFLADVASDPFVLDVSEMIPGSEAGAVAGALKSFETSLVEEPAVSFMFLERTLNSVYSGAELAVDPDAEMAGQAMDLYRDLAALTIFGVERDSLAPYIEPIGN